MQIIFTAVEQLGGEGISALYDVLSWMLLLFIFFLFKDGNMQVNFLDNEQRRKMSRAPITFMKHVIILTYRGVLGCIQNNDRETGRGWNVLLHSRASLATAISHDCNKPACHCTPTISKPKGNNVILNGLHTLHPILKQTLMA